VKDPYQVLGVARSTDADAIKQAYRKLARELHPDINPGNKKAEERFKEISAAWDFLSDADKRAKYDRGEIDATGAPLRRSARSHGGGGGGFHPGNPFGGGNVDDILSELLRRKEKGRAQAHPKSSKGTDLRHSLTVTFAEAAAGASKRLTLGSGRTMELRIPAGTTDGQTLRLKGQGNPSGMVEGEPGDAYIEIKVAEDAFFTRRELDVLVDLPVSLPEAVLGGKVTVPTIDGRVTLTVPPGSNTGTVLRLKGKGVAGANGAKGDQLVTLKVVLPENDAELKKFVEKWGPRNGYDPRNRSWGEA
jgi:DnaJ-class molecular chaperone